MNMLNVILITFIFLASQNLKAQIKEQVLEHSNIYIQAVNRAFNSGEDSIFFEGDKILLFTDVNLFSNEIKLLPEYILCLDYHSIRKFSKKKNGAIKVVEMRPLTYVNKQFTIEFILSKVRYKKQNYQWLIDSIKKIIYEYDCTTKNLYLKEIILSGV